MLTIWIDTAAKTFSSVQPDLTGRIVISQGVPNTISLQTLFAILNAIMADARAGGNTVYRVDIAEL